MITKIAWYKIKTIEQKMKIINFTLYLIGILLFLTLFLGPYSLVIAIVSTFIVYIIVVAITKDYLETLRRLAELDAIEKLAEKDTTKDDKDII